VQDFLSVAEAAAKYNISNRRVQLLCEKGRIENAQMISGVWLIPASAKKPPDGRKRKAFENNQMPLFDVGMMDFNRHLSFTDACEMLSISHATGRNWIKLGKLIPDREDGKQLYFLRDDIEKILHAVTNGDSNVLNRRRNKKKASGISLYENYISCKYNIDLVSNIIIEYGTSISPALLRAILTNYALQFICGKIGQAAIGNMLGEYLKGELDIGFFDVLISDLLGDVSDVDLSSGVFETTAKYVESEDTLGFIYISLMNIGMRKASGTYYTPYKVVNRLVENLIKTVDIIGKSVLDPCCGSGNFLLAIGEKTDTPEMIYGQDIDLVAVKLVRISFALKYGITDVDFLFTHFTCADTLTSFTENSFDIIVGNPPWGGELTKEQTSNLAMYYRTVLKNGTETYNLFTERSLSLLSENGILAFVLPEAILNVAAHSTIRNILISECNFRFVCYLGNVFSGVQCPAIILGAEKSRYKANGVDEVRANGESYRISSNRQINVERLNFHVKDEQQDCIDALTNIPGCRTLSDNAKFALGIVTGDNAAYISDVCHKGYEPVLKGSDVKKFRVEAGGKYIRFVPQSFQQVAPTELYRAPEKLLYRFICENLVFAYDNQQILSLNSCNILIPQISGMDIKYILAILNSRAASFFFAYMFKSIKVLRSQLEQIPIPVASDNEQTQIIGLVDRLIDGDANIAGLYDELDDCIMSIYDLSNVTKQTITTSLSKRNLFLT